ncbi:MAG: hypothetical protein NTZ31_06005 [Actinobacteria bacterium]|jgi:D-alanine-D-alanine ligase|nr:hypothetical protein [Actinomycetota bacterium]
MSEDKFHVGVVLGGKNSDNHRSCRAAGDIITTLQGKDYTVSAFGVTLEGQWVLFSDLTALSKTLETWPFELTNQSASEIKGALVSQIAPKEIFEIDIAFLTLSGVPGIEGSVQGLFESHGVRVVGSDVIASAICADKSTLKMLLRGLEIPTPYHIVIPNKYWMRDPFTQATRAASVLFPQIIKPARGSNGLGITMIKYPVDFKNAMEVARNFDARVIVEKFQEKARYLECSVLEDGQRQVYISTILETKLKNGTDLLNYVSRMDSDNYEHIFPSDLSEEVVTKIKDYAEQVFEATKSSAYLQVKFVINQENELMVLGATNHPYLGRDGTFAKVWLESGLEYEDFIDSSIAEGLNRPAGLD